MTDYIETDSDDIPLALLLEADPSEANIQTYLSGAWCYAAKLDGVIIAACIVKPIDENLVEIFNIAVHPNQQGKGTGSKFLRYVIAQLREKKVQRVELGTGTFGYQLAYYQRLGFRVDSVIKNHFLTNYPEPVIENGIQHKDMLRLYLDLQP